MAEERKEKIMPSCQEPPAKAGGVPRIHFMSVVLEHMSEMLCISEHAQKPLVSDTQKLLVLCSS